MEATSERRRPAARRASRRASRAPAGDESASQAAMSLASSDFVRWRPRLTVSPLTLTRDNLARSRASKSNDPSFQHWFKTPRTEERVRLMVFRPSPRRTSSARSFPSLSTLTECHGRPQAAANRAAAFPSRPGPVEAGIAVGARIDAAKARRDAVEVLAALVVRDRT